MKPFEREVVRLLAEAHLGTDLIARVSTSPPRSCEHTGAGYLLTIGDEALPKGPLTFHRSDLLGRGGDVEIGFVVFIEQHALTLECHSWGDEVPTDIREQDVEIALLPQAWELAAHGA